MQKKLLLLLGLPFLLGGCASTCVTIPANSAKTYNVGGWFGDVQVASPSTKLSGNILQAKANVRNKTSSAQNFQYKFSWFDKSGFQVGENAPWSPVQLYPDASKQIYAVAPSSNAVNFDVQVCSLNN